MLPDRLFFVESVFAVVGFFGLKLEFAALDELSTADTVDPFSEVLVNDKNAESEKSYADSDENGAAHSVGEIDHKEHKEEAYAENDDSTGGYVFTGVCIFFFKSFFHD